MILQDLGVYLVKVLGVGHGDRSHALLGYLIERDPAEAADESVEAILEEFVGAEVVRADDVVGHASKQLNDGHGEAGAVLAGVAVDENGMVLRVGYEFDDLADLAGLLKDDLVIEVAEKFAEAVLARSTEEATQDSEFTGLVERDVDGLRGRACGPFARLFRRAEIANSVDAVIAEKHAGGVGEAPRIVGTVERPRLETGDGTEVGNGDGQCRYARRSCR